MNDKNKKVVVCGFQGSNKMLLSTAMLLASMRDSSDFDFVDNLPCSSKGRKNKPKNDKPKKVWYTADSPEVKAITQKHKEPNNA